MFKHIVKSAMAVVFGLTLAGIAHCQPVDAWFAREIYSNADGSVQFIVFEINFSSRIFLPPVTGQTLVASNGSTDRVFMFPYNTSLSCDENFCGFLVGTQGFADLNLARPDGKLARLQRHIAHAMRMGLHIVHGTRDGLAPTCRGQRAQRLLHHLNPIGLVPQRMPQALV